MLIPVLILLSIFLVFLGFIVKQNLWGVGNFIAKDDEKGQCSIGYWVTMVGVIMLIFTLILYRLKKVTKTARNSAASAYGSARNSAASAYGSARNSAVSARTKAIGMFKSKSASPPTGVEMASFE